MPHPPLTHLPPYTRTLATKTMIATRCCSCSYYSTTLNNTDISTSNKDKTPISINSVKTYTKEQLTTEIQRLTTTNIQLITNKIETEKTRVNLKANKIQLFDEKNSLIVKKEKL